MPDNKFSNTDRVNLTPSALSSGISGLSLNPQASLSATTQSEQTSRYNTTRDLLSQMTSLQGRLPTEADQKLQGLLKSIRQELLLLGNNLSEPSPPPPGKPVSDDIQLHSTAFIAPTGNLTKPAALTGHTSRAQSQHNIG